MTLAERLAEALVSSAGRDAVPSGDDVSLTGTVAPAAVLVAIVDRPEPGVILTQRADTLRQHAGQVAFPGGRVDAADADAVAAALREAEEEVGLPATAVTVVGLSDSYRTGSGFEIVPVIGVVPPGLTLVPAEAEVASVFEAPLGFLLDAANHAEGLGEWRGRQRRFYDIRWQDQRIWGATAGIIVNLARRLRWS